MKISPDGGCTRDARLSQHRREKTAKFTASEDTTPQRVPRTLLIHLENPINKDQVLKSAYHFKDFNKQVFVSPELSPVDAKKGNECLKTRPKTNRRKQIRSQKNSYSKSNSGSKWCMGDEHQIQRKK